MGRYNLIIQCKKRICGSLHRTIMPIVLSCSTCQRIILTKWFLLILAKILTCDHKGFDTLKGNSKIGCRIDGKLIPQWWQASHPLQLSWYHPLTLQIWTTTQLQLSVGTGVSINSKLWGGRLYRFLDHITWHNLLVMIIHSWEWPKNSVEHIIESSNLPTGP
jgi:hypothetical protein